MLAILVVWTGQTEKKFDVYYIRVHSTDVHNERMNERTNDDAENSKQSVRRIST